jgi:tetratricopeptide (TPR) repeat protein
MDGLSDLVERAASAGHDREDALMAAAVKLGHAVVSSEGSSELLVQFADGAPPPMVAMALPQSAVAMVMGALAGPVTAVETRAWMLVEGGSAPKVVLPDDAPLVDWGLSEGLKQLIEQTKSAAELRDVEVEGADGWAGIATLRLLGILSVVGEVEELAFATEPVAPPLVPEQSLASAKPVEARSRERTDRSRQAPKPRDSPAAAKPKQPRKRSSKLEALKRSPWESSADEVEEDLKSAYDAMGEVRPESCLLIRKSEDLNKDNIEKQYREACARYHPDRYLGSSQAVSALAEGCFSRISEAYHFLKEPPHQQQARERLLFRETGKRPVNDKTRGRASVYFRRAELLFRQQKYDDARKLIERTLAGDPDRWEYRYLGLQIEWHAGTLGTQEVVDGIKALEGLDGRQRGEARYVAGEMLHKDGREKEAFALFKMALEADPNNVGARRRIRLKQNRKTQQAESGKSSAGKDKKGSGGLFGGLFGRRGS